MKRVEINQALIWIVAAVSTIFSGMTAAESKVEFTEAKKFSDYELTGHSRKQSLKLLKVDLVKLFDQLTNKELDQGQTIEVNVTNIDLPGIMRYAYGASHQDIRVIKSNTPYKLYFEFSIKSAGGSVLKQGEFKLKEFANHHLSSMRNRNRSTVGYFKEPLKKWLTKTMMES
ncbi:MAG: DUF3016 domain-containing protein [Kangiellaceae bacterium]|nr:DUF3016 domain-containing protein [Kangiellaceae bacterium]